EEVALLALEEEAADGAGVVHGDAAAEHAPHPTAGAALPQQGPQAGPEPAQRAAVFGRCRHRFRLCWAAPVAVVTRPVVRVRFGHDRTPPFPAPILRTLPTPCQKRSARSTR